MDGAKALAFARERYGFADGDNQRGKNQMAILQALTAKLTKASSLVNYQSILSAVSNNMTTNLAYDDITALVRTQLASMSEWKIDTYAVTQGSGSTSVSRATLWAELRHGSCRRTRHLCRRPGR